MKLKRVSFIAPVSCGGTLTSCTAGSVVGDRLGATPFDIELITVGEFPCVRISKRNNGVSTNIPLTNVSNFEPFTADELKQIEAKSVKK